MKVTVLFIKLLNRLLLYVNRRLKIYIIEKWKKNSDKFIFHASFGKLEKIDIFFQLQLKKLISFFNFEGSRNGSIHWKVSFEIFMEIPKIFMEIPKIFRHNSKTFLYQNFSIRISQIFHFFSNFHTFRWIKLFKERKLLKNSCLKFNYLVSQVGKLSWDFQGNSYWKFNRNSTGIPKISNGNSTNFLLKYHRFFMEIPQIFHWNPTDFSPQFYKFSTEISQIFH